MAHSKEINLNEWDQLYRSLNNSAMYGIRSTQTGDPVLKVEEISPTSFSVVRITRPQSKVIVRLGEDGRSVAMEGEHMGELPLYPQRPVHPSPSELYAKFNGERERYDRQIDSIAEPIINRVLAHY